MAYTLFVGDRPYSSWSLRGWLLLDAFGIPFRSKLVPMYSADFTAMQKAHAPARMVPTLRVEEEGGSYLVWESLAIAETVAEAFPEAGLWPQEAEARGAARALAGEMHAGFRALRGACPMNLRKRYKGFTPDEAVTADAQRIEELWCWALAKFGGPYLGGAAFTAVDAMYAPVATRFVTYGFALSADAQRYVETLYAHPSFRRWHAMSDATRRELSHYDMWIAEAENAGPPRAPVIDAAIHQGQPQEAINALCPFSGDPVVAEGLARVEGKIVGFCNGFCRDKAIADAEAWPEVIVLLRS